MQINSNKLVANMISQKFAVNMFVVPITVAKLEKEKHYLQRKYMPLIFILLNKKVK